MRRNSNAPDPVERTGGPGSTRSPFGPSLRCESRTIAGRYEQVKFVLSCLTLSDRLRIRSTYIPPATESWTRSRFSLLGTKPTIRDDKKPNSITSSKLDAATVVPVVRLWSDQLVTEPVVVSGKHIPPATESWTRSRFTSLGTKPTCCNNH
jgi:hypothetical protein